MVIRAEQMHNFDRSARTQFALSQEQRLRYRFPRETRDLSSAVLPNEIGNGIRRAAGYSVTAARDIELFLDCMLMLGSTFDNEPRIPWARRILNRGDLSGTEKMSLIHDRLLFQGY